jgi:putative oxidoreductase
MGEDVAPTSFTRRVLASLTGATKLLDRFPMSLLTLSARIFPAAIFWQAGQTKVVGWQVTDSAVFLFAQEYRLPLVDPWLAAHLAAVAEHVFPLLLVLGLASRLSATALLIMTAIIQIFVYASAWPTHGVWAVCLTLVIVRGPGLFSLDHVFLRSFASLKTSRRNAASA